MTKKKTLNITSVDEYNGMYKCEGHKDKIFLNFDRYNIEKCSALSTKQFAVVVDFDEREITGDCIAYGDWFDIDLKECCDLLLQVHEEDEMKRDFKDILAESLWKLLAEVTFDFMERDFKDTLAEDFFFFEEGTERKELWNWFDEMHSKGVDYLIKKYNK